jgi:hypothetical protein
VEFGASSAMRLTLLIGRKGDIMLNPFRTISALARMRSTVQGDFSFVWYGDKATMYVDSFTFAMPHQWRVNGFGVKGSQF